jgi:hypothetical protein
MRSITREPMEAMRIRDDVEEKTSKLPQASRSLTKFSRQSPR